MTAAESPHVAQALAEKYRSESKMSDDRFQQMQEFMAQQQGSSKDHADRLERVMSIALQQMGTAATSRAQAQGPGSQTVITPGGMGGVPVVINPQGSTEEKACPKCDKIIPSNSRFCPNCRAKL